MGSESAVLTPTCARSSQEATVTPNAEPNPALLNGNHSGTDFREEAQQGNCAQFAGIDVRNHRVLTRRMEGSTITTTQALRSYTDIDERRAVGQEYCVTGSVEEQENCYQRYTQRSDEFRQSGKNQSFKDKWGITQDICEDSITVEEHQATARDCSEEIAQYKNFYAKVSGELEAITACEDRVDELCKQYHELHKECGGDSAELKALVTEIDTIQRDLVQKYRGMQEEIECLQKLAHDPECMRSILCDKELDSLVEEVDVQIEEFTTRKTEINPEIGRYLDKEEHDAIKNEREGDLDALEGLKVLETSVARRDLEYGSAVELVNLRSQLEEYKELCKRGNDEEATQIASYITSNWQEMLRKSDEIYHETTASKSPLEEPYSDISRAMQQIIDEEMGVHFRAAQSVRDLTKFFVEEL
jgi:hypothetical protein